VIRPRSNARKGDALVRRHIAQWRRVTARLQVLMNTGAGADALADEAAALRRQCERLSCDLGHVETAARQQRCPSAL
jgi:hypothetical protein